LNKINPNHIKFVSENCRLYMHVVLNKFTFCPEKCIKTEVFLRENTHTISSDVSIFLYVLSEKGGWYL